MKRRTLIAAGTVGLIGAGGAGVALGLGPFASENDASDYRGKAPIVYDRTDLVLELRNEPVHRSETATFAITNVGDSRNILGCGNPWALESERDGQWVTVTWTRDRLLEMCATFIDTGGTRTIEVPFAERALAAIDGAAEPAVALEPGTYRLILIGIDPYLVVDFELLPAGA